MDYIFLNYEEIINFKIVQKPSSTDLKAVETEADEAYDFSEIGTANQVTYLLKPHL